MTSMTGTSRGSSTARVARLWSDKSAMTGPIPDFEEVGPFLSENCKDILVMLRGAGRLGVRVSQQADDPVISPIMGDVERGEARFIPQKEGDSVPPTAYEQSAAA